MSVLGIIIAKLLKVKGFYSAVFKLEAKSCFLRTLRSLNRTSLQAKK